METIENLVNDEIRELFDELKKARESSDYRRYSDLTNALAKLTSIKRSFTKD